jgi:hypothetical protein
MNPFGIECYRSKRMPRSEKAMYAVAILAVFVVIAFNNFH